MNPEDAQLILSAVKELKDSASGTGASGAVVASVMSILGLILGGDKIWWHLKRSRGDTPGGELSKTVAELSECVKTLAEEQVRHQEAMMKAIESMAEANKEAVRDLTHSMVDLRVEIAKSNSRTA